MPENATRDGKAVQWGDFQLDVDVVALLEDRFEAAARIWVGNLLAAGLFPIAVFAVDRAAEACHQKSMQPERPGAALVKLTRMNSMYWAWEVVHFL